MQKFIKINGVQYDCDKFSFEDFKSITKGKGTKTKFEKLTGKKTVTKPKETETVEAKKVEAKKEVKK